MIRANLVQMRILDIEYLPRHSQEFTPPPHPDQTQLLVKAATACWCDCVLFSRRPFYSFAPRVHSQNEEFRSTHVGETYCCSIRGVHMPVLSGKAQCFHLLGREETNSAGFVWPAEARLQNCLICPDQMRGCGRLVPMRAGFRRPPRDVQGTRKNRIYRRHTFAPLSISHSWTGRV